jgi:hypothetical protein
MSGSIDFGTSSYTRPVCVSSDFEPYSEFKLESSAEKEEIFIVHYFWQNYDEARSRVLFVSKTFEDMLAFVKSHFFTSDWLLQDKTYIQREISAKDIILNETVFFDIKNTKSLDIEERFGDYTLKISKVCIGEVLPKDCGLCDL